MVALIGNIANKFFFSTSQLSTTSNLVALALPTMSVSNYMGMDSSKGQTPANNIEVRRRTSSSAINISREPLMASSG